MYFVTRLIPTKCKMSTLLLIISYLIFDYLFIIFILKKKEITPPLQSLFLSPPTLSFMFSPSPNPYISSPMTTATF